MPPSSSSSSSFLPLASAPCSSSPSSPDMAVPLHHHHHHHNHNHRLTSSLPSISKTTHLSSSASDSISPHSPLLCLLCFKEFPSSRSLAGHMRIHGGLLHGSHQHNQHQLPYYYSPPPLPTMNTTAIVGGTKALLRIYGGGTGEALKLCHDHMAAPERVHEEDAGGVRVDESAEDRRRRKKTKKKRRSSSSFESAEASSTTVEKDDDAEELASAAGRYVYGGSGAEYLTTDQIPAKPRYKVVDSLIRSASHMKPLNLQPSLACHICGKSFFSQHALSGHMRCHGGGGGAAHRPRPPPAVTPSYADQSIPRIKVLCKHPPLPTKAAVYAADSYGSRRANSWLDMDTSMLISSHRPEPPTPALIKGKSLSSSRRKRCPSLFFQLHRRPIQHVAESHDITLQHPKVSVDVYLNNVSDTSPTGVDAVAAEDDSAACSLLMLRAAKTEVGPARLGVGIARNTGNRQTKDRIFPVDEEEAAAAAKQVEEYEVGDEEEFDDDDEEAAADIGGGRVYECQTCRRWAEAMGGHRESHNKKKVIIGGDGAGLQFRSEDRHPWERGSYGGASIHGRECSMCRRNGNNDKGRRRGWWPSRRSGAGEAAVLCHIDIAGEASSVNVPPPSSTKIGEQQALHYAAARGGGGGRSGAIDLNVAPPVVAEEEDVLSWEAAVGDARKRLCIMSGVGAGGRTRLFAGEATEGGSQGLGIIFSKTAAAWDDARRRHKA